MKKLNISLISLAFIIGLSICVKGFGQSYRSKNYSSKAYSSSYKAPSYKMPSYRAPTYKAPSYKSPSYKAPAYKASSYKSPSYKAPSYKGPGSKAPTYKVPSYKPPSSKVPTYNAYNATKYKSGEVYSNGMPKVDRSEAAKRQFLKSRGYDKVPPGYEVDHIIPLSQGGADAPYNMQLIPIGMHRLKTANERKH